MADKPKGQPTASELIFVGSGPGADHAAEFSLTLLDWLLREEAISLPGSVDGEISAWIKDYFAKPVELQPQRISERDAGAVQREVMREAAVSFADPGEKEELRFMAQLGNVSPADTQRLMKALQQEDDSAFQKTRSEMVEALYQRLRKQITGEGLAALVALGTRDRAGRAAALCMVLYKTHPLSLMAQARGGDQGAVLSLIKIDKLFLTDSCTAGVIRQAELQNDNRFLGKLARAVAYEPQTNWRQGCRLYLYGLLSFGVPLPSLPKLQLRLDPEGSRFQTAGAFEKFVERSRKEFAEMVEGLPDNSEGRAQDV